MNSWIWLLRKHMSHNLGSAGYKRIPPAVHENQCFLSIYWATTTISKMFQQLSPLSAQPAFNYITKTGLGMQPKIIPALPEIPFLLQISAPVGFS